MQDITRRGFVSAAGTAVAASAIAGTAIAEEAPAVEWACETDVVVIGYGGAGAAAAIEARAAGAEVIVLEKDAFGGGDTAVAFGAFLDIVDVDAACNYLMTYHAQNYSECDADAIKVYCEQSVGLAEWVAGLAGDDVISIGGASDQSIEGAEGIAKMLIVANDYRNGGRQMFEAMRTIVEGEGGAQVMYGTPAVKLIASDGEVQGVVAEGPDGQFNIKARKAVIIATGSYENDERTKQNIFPSPTAVLGTPANTGDGIRLAQMLGADLWHLNGIGGCGWGMKCGDGFKTAAYPSITAGSYIWVDIDGNRFFNEAAMESHSTLIECGHFDTVSRRHLTVPMFNIFDDTTRAAAPVVNKVIGYHTLYEYDWSEDNSAEVEAGWIISADTLEELAEKIGCPAENLVASVDAWNEACASGEDPFGRDMTGAVPMDTPPFYAIETYPATMGVQAGTRRNTACQILNVEGNPIPRLYGAGEMGSIWGSMFEPGVAIGEALVTGRIAGREAAALDSWE